MMNVLTEDALSLPATKLAAAADTIAQHWPIGDPQVQTLVDDLRRNDERTRLALGVARTGVWEAELFTGQVEWSETMPLAMGRSVAAFDGTLDGMATLLHHDDRDKFMNVVHGNFEHPTSFLIDVRVLQDGDQPRWVQLRGQIAPEADGMSVCLVSVAQDVTEQKLLEQKLHHAQKLEAMGRLAGGVAHDFNNLLTAILGYAMLMEEDAGLSATTCAQAVQIRKAAERATVLTRQLLGFSRKQVLERRALHLAAVVVDVEPMLRQILGERVRLECDIPADVHPVSGDPGQLQQVLLNLAINARDAMPDGGVLTVSGSNVTLSEGDRMPRPKLALGDYAVLTVVDTGTGMDASVQSRIFEPFFTTKVAGLGTGLGLSTVFEIVKGMSGAIRVSSELGAGTVFRIYLPRTATVATLLPTAATASVAGGSERVLIVEDEEAVLQLVGDTLRRNGYSVLTALGAEQALAVVAGSDRPIDLVVTDVMMPNGTGPDLVAELDRTTTCRRALYMSGYAGAALARQGKLAADSEFLQKPFTGTQLLSKVRELLDSAAV